MSSPPPPNPISLSDAQLTAVMTAAAALQPSERDPFLRSLAHRLRGEEIGDGSVARAIRELMAGGYFKPPVVTTPQPPRLSSKAHQAPPILASARR